MSAGQVPVDATSAAFGPLREITGVEPGQTIDGRSTTLVTLSCGHVIRRFKSRAYWEDRQDEGRTSRCVRCLDEEVDAMLAARERGRRVRCFDDRVFRRLRERLGDDVHVALVDHEIREYTPRTTH